MHAVTRSVAALGVVLIVTMPALSAQHPHATFRPSSESTTSGNGFGLIAGAGYDVRIGRNVSVTPVGTFFFGDDGHVTGGGLPAPQSVKHSVIELGLGITFH